MRISDWSSGVCSSDRRHTGLDPSGEVAIDVERGGLVGRVGLHGLRLALHVHEDHRRADLGGNGEALRVALQRRHVVHDGGTRGHRLRSEEHTSELQSLMRISYAVFCLKKKKKQTKET